MKWLVRVAVLALILAVAFAFGFSWRDLQAGALPNPQAFGALVGQPTEGPTPAELYEQHYRHIQANYALPLPEDRLKYSGMQGLFGALGDPHTVFMEPQTAQEFAQDTEGNFVGVGAMLQRDPLGAKVSMVFRDGPAARAGLLGGDVITQVDTTDVAGMDTTEIVRLIRGEEGTTVVLHVIRNDAEGVTQIPVRRAKLIAPSALGQMLPGDIGYIQLLQFTQMTSEQFDRELAALDAQNPRGLIIDLRNNPGGLLDVAVEMLSKFVSNKVAVRMRFRNKGENVVRTPGNRLRQFEYPVVLLINEQSASAAEIFAGVLRDYRLATLVGEHTFGKASVQTVKPLIDLSSAKITIARYYLPGGEDISRRVDEEGEYVSGGLAPDVEAELELNSRTLLGDPERDSQLRVAMELVEQKRGQ